MQVFGILLPLPFNEVFDYKADQNLHIGDLVKVSFGREEYVGLVYKLGKSSNLDDSKIKPILAKLNFPPLSKPLLKFVEFTAQYNMAFLGLVLKMVLSVPQAFENEQFITFYQLSGKTLAEAKLKNSDARWHVLELLKKCPFTKAEICKGAGVTAAVVNKLIETGVLSSFVKEKSQDFAAPQANFATVNLNHEQILAADNLCAKVGAGFSATLLDGVTGSGKTEVYFEAMAKALEQGKQVLVLVPEITLTSQWLNRFKKRFGATPAVWHSALTNSQRTNTYQAVIKGNVKVLVGARSALFLPYQNLGLIVVDESHDSSFKQEEQVKYQGRDMAVVRAKFEQIPIVLSTATPALETIVNAQNGKFDVLKLTKRYAKASLPEVKIINLKADKPQKTKLGIAWLSPTLVKALDENLQKGEQSVLFLNRRGYAPLIICRDCGYKIECPNCTSWLTAHKQTHNLICHHCGYTRQMPKTCPNCGSTEGLTACGPGVERILDEVKERFPNAKTAILSSDITSSLQDITAVIEKMENGEIDILIGTQILAKGHNFPSLTLVGIVDADLGLQSSDLRATERTFQLLSQVAGRAGRAEKKGVVYVQTLFPQNLTLKALVDNNREAFLDIEKKARMSLMYPPFGNLAAIILSGADKETVEKTAILLGKTAFNSDIIKTLGPAPAPIYMLRGKYRYRFLLKTAKSVKIQDVIKAWLAKVKVSKKVKVEIDINPYNFM